MSKAFLMMSMVLTLTMLATGCGTQPGKPIVTYVRDQPTPPSLKTVDKQGLYALFPGDGIQPLEGAYVYLHAGDTFGFESSEGKVVGFYTKAGQTQTVPLDGVLTTDYVWKYQGDKQP